MLSRAWVVTAEERGLYPKYTVFQCSHGLELLHESGLTSSPHRSLFQCSHGLELLHSRNLLCKRGRSVSMLSRAWVVTSKTAFCFCGRCVSMLSRAWVVTARMSNILNFLWYFLCIPAIYKCILAYLSIFFNQLSEFLRCESPSTFLGTCLSHHSFIW